MKVASVKGMKDVLPTAEGEEALFNARIWARIEAATHEIFRRYVFERIHTPVVEEAQLYARAVGEVTDIVGKEMYAFPDRAGKKTLALRPEGTAGAVRAFVEHGLGMRDPVQRWWYLGPMFRHERMQRYRYRQFFQIGAECFGVAAPEADVEMLAVCRDLLEDLGIEGVELRLNSLGDAACRPAYLERLTSYLRERADRLCAECRDRLGRNPLRVLDCKNEGCREVTAGAPASIDHLCEPCAAHFARVRAGAEALGIPYRVDPRLVRGLDYYTRTAFEYLAPSLGAGQQTAVCGGGRYDALVRQLGGPDTPAVGFSMGVERLCAILAQAHGIPQPQPVLFVALGDDAGRDQAMGLATRARSRGLATEVDLRGGRVARQLARADKRGARFSVVIGGAEVESGRVRLKEMATGQETEVALSAVVEAIVSRR